MPYIRENIYGKKLNWLLLAEMEELMTLAFKRSQGHWNAAMTSCMFVMIMRDI